MPSSSSRRSSQQRWRVTSYQRLLNEVVPIEATPDVLQWIHQTFRIASVESNVDRTLSTIVRELLALEAKSGGA
jgi:hypothetical protein